ncbi:hypothetical protein U1Q18_024399 [Sarracenia purpurea var. burkii]
MAKKLESSSHFSFICTRSPSKLLDHKLSSRSNGKAKHRSGINGGFFLLCSPARKIQAAGAGEGEERGERAPKPVFGAGSSYTIHRFRDRKDDVTTEDDDVPAVIASSRFASSSARLSGQAGRFRSCQDLVVDGFMDQECVDQDQLTEF